MFPPLGLLQAAARIVHVLLLGGWIGALATCGLLRQRAEWVLDSAHAADALARDLIGVIDGVGVLAGPVLLGSLVLGWRSFQAPLRGRAVGILLVTGLAALSRRWIGPRQAELVAELGRRLDDVDLGAPGVAELAQLEQVGVVLSVLLASILVWLLAAAIQGSQPRRRFAIEL